MRDELLAGFPVTLPWPVAWGDMDAFQHVNNVTYFRWFETARIAYFEAIGWAPPSPASAIGPILARTTCVFRAPLTFPDRVLLGARASDLQDDRFTMHYRVISERLGKIAADGEGTVVAFDYHAGVKARLPASVRAAILAIEAGGHATP